MFKYFFNKGYISVNNAAKVSTPKLHEKPIIRLDSDEVFDIINFDVKIFTHNFLMEVGKYIQHFVKHSFYLLKL